MGFDLDGWCARVPGLGKVGPDFWSAGDISDVSFPEGGLSMLGDVEEKSFWFIHRNRFIEGAVRRHPPAGPIFDIGGGNGIVARHLAEAGFQSVVVEPDAVGAALAHRRGLPVIAAAFQDMDIAPGALPAAGLFDVLEHIPEEEATLRGLAHAIRPGGRLYISVPAYDLLWADEDVHSGHCRRYTLGRLCRVVTEAGFRIDYASYLFAALVPLVLLLRTLPYRLGVKPTHDEEKVARDHVLPGSFSGRMLQASLDFELTRAQRGGRIPVGSSCFVAATRAPRDGRETIGTRRRNAETPA
ncbi:MAG: class I SAM-dependent methyltransferase [Rhizobiales bacterium]|nr:class I SAM-dependent methyltransferase [Hyphomicrobiales bacterium]